MWTLWIRLGIDVLRHANGAYCHNLVLVDYLDPAVATCVKSRVHGRWCMHAALLIGAAEDWMDMDSLDMVFASHRVVLRG